MTKLLKLLFIIALSVAPNVRGADTLYIYCLDVGQGDATLIVSPTGQTMLVDAGNNGEGEDKVLPLLDSLNITSLDYIVATHYHADHIGGVDEVVNGLSIDSIGIVYDRGWSYTTQTYYDYANAVGPIRTTIQDSQVIDLGGGAEVTCVSVNGNAVLDTPFTQPPHNENDLCVALKLEYGEFDFFVAGDLSGATTSDYTDIETSVAPEVGRIEVYHVDHHASKYNSNQCFVDSLRPKVSIISVGENPYGHPTQEVIQRLEAVPSVIYQTEDGDGNVVDGDITIKVCLDSFWVNGDGYPNSVGLAVNDDNETMPKRFSLYQNYPNPFNAETEIRYNLPQDCEVKLNVFNILGERVATLIEQRQTSGYKMVRWDAGSFPSGIYLYRLEAGEFDQTKMMVLLK